MVQLSELFAHIDFLLDSVPKLTEQITKQLDAILIPVIVFSVVLTVIAVISFIVCIVYYAKSEEAVKELVREEGNRSLMNDSLRKSLLEEERYVSHQQVAQKAESSSYVKTPSIDDLPSSPYSIYHQITSATVHEPVIVRYNQPDIMVNYELQKTYSELKLQNLRLKNKTLEKYLKNMDSSSDSEGECDDCDLLGVPPITSVSSCPNMKLKQRSAQSLDTVKEEKLEKS
ncbi:hypothetical protein L596_021441 [Steinernema carpocapsae]|uniref:Uncharacterized protein n=1 Tax=Steinernema carpocapsae TaxID=34508 RepID=A0A4U5MIQ1_STECR|nr:hypothetical protein L596_021441 [Steinernema carpocapsae]